MGKGDQGRSVLGCPVSKDTGNLLGTVILKVKHSLQLLLPPDFSFPSCI